jgi:hypothetical protein
MNKINKIILVAAIILGGASCSDSFLDEKYTTGYTTQYFESEEGLNSLAISLYGNIRYHFGADWAYGITSYGCDEFSTGTDLTSEPWNIYDSRLAPYTTGVNGNVPKPSDLWDQMYYGISSANTIIAGEKYFGNEDTKDLCMGEAYFLRGFNYYKLVANFGGVVLKTTPSVGVERSFSRSSAEECTNQLVNDLKKAYELLPETSPRGYGGWTKATAGHFYAKAMLFRCSERNDDWNNDYKEQDLKDIITVSDYVIAARPLAADYRDLWKWTGVDCEAEKNPEFLLVALFNADASTAGRYMNRTYPYFTSQFSNYSGSWVKRGVSVGLDFQRCRPTEYNYATYDKVNDSRFWKTFKTTYNANAAGGFKYTYKDENGLNKRVSYNTAIGDLAIVFICNDKNDARFGSYTFGSSGTAASLEESNTWFVNPATGKEVPNAFIHYRSGQWQNYAHNIFAGISKYEDGSRTAEKDNGNRDGVLARTGETYLIKAEALVRQGKYDDAIAVVNQLRKRAEYKAGENRASHTDGTLAFENNSLFTDATSLSLYKGYSNVNSYYLSTGITETTDATSLQIASPAQLPAEDEAILADLGVTSDYDRMLNFLMNERTRELNGEFVRWEDLSRTKLLLLRAKKFNNEVATANAIKEHHLLRPIPQSFIDGLQNNDGGPLSDAEKKALQNPGYY